MRVSGSTLRNPLEFLRGFFAWSFSICASVNRGSTWKVILPSSYRGEDVSGGWLDPSLAFFFFILRYFEKFLPLIDGTGALLLISMLIVLLLLFFLYINTIMFSTVKTNIAKDYVLL